MVDIEPRQILNQDRLSKLGYLICSIHPNIIQAMHDSVLVLANIHPQCNINTNSIAHIDMQLVLIPTLSI